MQRRAFMRTAGIAGGLMAVSPLLGGAVVIADTAFPEADTAFPLMDLHVHTTDKFTIEDIVAIGRRTNIQFGVLDHPGYGINTDADLKHYIERLRPYPVYIGLQPMSPGWSKRFSSELLSRLDYVLMDPQTVPMGNGYGETLWIWEFDTYVDDTNAFMERYMAHTMDVLSNDEPMTILGWPLFLPVCIARDYYTLWTTERMQQIVSAAKKRNIAIEINDIAHTPHEAFIQMAKDQGLKFAFGSDARNQKAGRLDYCKAIAKKCGLERQHFYVPERIIEKG